MNINYYSPINSTGYGIASLNILKSLHKNNQVSYFPIGEPAVDNQQDYDTVLSLFHNADTADINAPCVKIWHQFDLMQRIGRGQYYAYPFFELDQFNDREKLHMSVPDHLFVSSKWAEEVVKNNNIKTETSVVPLGVDISVFNHTKYSKQQKEKYVFLNIGKWEIRKGHDILLQLFNNAFPNNENVELWILASESTNGYSNEQELQKWKSMYKSDRIRLFSGAKNHHDIASLIAQCDCGIYPSRAEGWNLELLETMAMNKPAITTNYSAHTEFCNNDNCYLVDIDETEKALDGKAFRGQGNWAKIGQKQIDDIISHMRYVYKNNINTNLNGLKTAELFSWDNSANHMARCIRE